MVMLAAGSGSRFGRAKQFERIGKHTMLTHALLAAGQVAGGIVVVLPAQDARLRPAPAAASAEFPAALGLPGTPGCPVVCVAGGEQRADSVRAALAAIPAEAGIIVVADSSHPLASPALYRRVVDAVRDGSADAALPGLALTEVIATVQDGVRTGGLPRAGHVLAQTPQAFRADVLRAAHAAAPAVTEDSALVADHGARVVVVPGEERNIHVTTVQELEMARALARAPV